MTTIDPTSSAAKIAATANTSETPQDWRLRNGSPAEHWRTDLRDALQRGGVPVNEVDASLLARILNRAPSSGDADEVATEIIAQHPDLIVTRPRPSSSRIVEQFRAGQTTVTPGS